jgi:hypothetical protein
VVVTASVLAVIASISVTKPSSGLAADRWHAFFIFAAECPVRLGQQENWVFAKQVGP